jgi:hypothetical protein
MTHAASFASGGMVGKGKFIFGRGRCFCGIPAPSYVAKIGTIFDCFSELDGQCRRRLKHARTGALHHNRRWQCRHNELLLTRRSYGLLDGSINRVTGATLIYRFLYSCAHMID